jgi:hypothetical protein
MANEPIIDVDLGQHNGTLKFFSTQEIHDFTQNEQNFWSWLNSSPVNRQIKQPWNVISQHISQIQNQLPGFGDGSDEGNRGLMQDHLRRAFQNTRIPLSTSPVGEFVSQLKDESPTVAAAALASWMNTGGLDIGNFEHTKGVMLMAAFDAGISRKTPAAVKRSLEGIQKQLQTAKAKTEKETRDQRDVFKNELTRQRKSVARSLRQGRRLLTAFRSSKDAQVNQSLSHLGEQAMASIASIQETENLYREHMRLKGPVEYWSQKAEAHRTKTLTYRNFLVGFSVLASLALVGSLYWIAGHAIEIATTDKPPAVYLVLVTLGVVLTTIVFWAARILTRLFLSEHHLAIDAEERSIMAQTYLALTAEGQATEQERAIVLGSLFRPTADGIVKDDAAPDLSPAALLSRLGAR